MVSFYTPDQFNLIGDGATNVIINGCNLTGYTAAFQSGGTGTGITGNLT